MFAGRAGGAGETTNGGKAKFTSTFTTDLHRSIRLMRTEDGSDVGCRHGQCIVIQH